MQKKTKENFIDLSSEENGGCALLASDEFFAPKENMLKKGRGEFIPDKYTELGKWMDGRPEDGEKKDMTGALSV